MLYVRNPTGVSHSPEEHAEDADCAAGVTALTAVLRELAGRPDDRLSRTPIRGARATEAPGRRDDRVACRSGRRPGGRRSRPMTGYWAAAAHLPHGLAADVTFEIADGRFTDVKPGTAPGDARRLPGVVLPGFANAHSHAFHRALRGRTHGGGGTFWTWREAMYAVAARLDPDSYRALATAAYAEMASAGVTAVAEFHYVHHGPGGVPYAEPHAMRAALRAAAADAGIRLTLLDTCYLAGGFDTPLEGPQLRFGDRDVHAWAERAAGADGVAVHSVRAVPRDALAVVAKAAEGRPLHVHLSEQPAENAACLARHGLTPTGLLAAEGVLGQATTAVHATHLTDADIALLGVAHARRSFRPSTPAAVIASTSCFRMS